MVIRDITALHQGGIGMNFRLDQASLAEALAELDRRCWLFDQLPIDPQHADWLRKRAWIRTIHGTTRIEGNTASDVEVEALLAGEAEGELKITKKEGREIIGTRESLSLVDRLAQDGVDPDEGVIREVHKLVLWNQSPLLTPGAYRKGENRVEGPNGRLIFHTPPSGDVDDLMHDFGVWLRTGAEAYPAPIAAALAHLEFVAIHPFNDGNGRTARALARLILTRNSTSIVVATSRLFAGRLVRLTVLDTTRRPLSTTCSLRSRNRLTMSLLESGVSGSSWSKSGAPSPIGQCRLE
jgi:Fic family protein